MVVPTIDSQPHCLYKLVTAAFSFDTVDAKEKPRQKNAEEISPSAEGEEGSAPSSA
jgi:hypothetical protein